MTTERHADPARELELLPALRDTAAGAALIAIGLLTGGSSLIGGDADRLDVAFDVLGGAWMLWGLARLVHRGLRRTC